MRQSRWQRAAVAACALLCLARGEYIYVCCIESSMGDSCMSGGAGECQACCYTDTTLNATSTDEKVYDPEMECAVAGAEGWTVKECADFWMNQVNDNLVCA